MPNRHRKRAAKRPNRHIVVPPQMRSEYEQFVTLVKEAQQIAEEEAIQSRRTPEELVDYRRSVEFLNTHQPLINYLKGIVQREEARAQAMGGGVPYAVSYAVPGFEEEFYAPPLQAGSRRSSKFGPPTGSTPQNSGNIAGWSTGGITSGSEPQGVGNYRILRYLADTNEWVRAAINIRRQQIGRADIAVIPLDEQHTWDRKVLKVIQQLFDVPNERRDSYRTIIEPVLEDILVLDRGCISKNMTPKRTPRALYFEDGATIKIYTDWSGDPREPRYLYEEENSSVRIPLYNDELICIAANPATYRTGLSPVQWLKKTIDADNRAVQSASHLVDMKPPPHLIQVPGAQQAQITNLRNNYDAEVAGRKELFWMGGDQQIQVHPLVFSAKDNQWLEWQKYLAGKIAVAFQITPQQLGFTDDVNRSTGEVQQDIYEDTGLIPLMLLLEEYFNRELLLDFAPRDRDGVARLDALNLRIVFPQISEHERQLHAEHAADIAVKSMAGLPSATLNQILLMRGEQPVPGGNTFWSSTKEGPVPWLSYDGEYGDWTPPFSTGGELGAQDPAGGMEEDEDDEVGDTSDGDNPAQQRLDAQAQQAQAKTKPAAKPSSKPSGKPGNDKAPASGKRPKANAPKNGPEGGDGSTGGTPNFQDGLTYPLSASPSEVAKQNRYTGRYDTRKPGQHWHPASRDHDYLTDE